MLIGLDIGFITSLAFYMKGRITFRLVFLEEVVQGHEYRISYGTLRNDSMYRIKSLTPHLGILITQVSYYRKGGLWAHHNGQS